jgi:dihydrofolate reductase
MRKIISFMHVSLDGFVAGPKGEMDWIKVNDEIFSHVEKRIGLGNSALYGRVTYQMMENYWPGAGDKPGASRHDVVHSKWYGKIEKIVISETMKDSVLPKTKIISENISERINEIKREAGNEILIFGSPTATHSLLKENLIDGFWLFVNPVILGKGIPLFTNIKDKIKLKLVTTRQFNCGVVELNYSVDR